MLIVSLWFLNKNLYISNEIINNYVMDFDDLYELNPSDAMARIRELKTKQEYEGLSKDELEELNLLKEMLKNTVGDLKEDYLSY